VTSLEVYLNWTSEYQRESKKEKAGGRKGKTEINLI